MTAPETGIGRHAAHPRRLVVFGATGQLGQELVTRLDENDWPISELVAVASTNSLGETFEFRGDDIDVLAEAPLLKGFDLVFICTRGAEVLEIVRECLRAEVPCIDLTGALSSQVEVPLSLPTREGDESGAAATEAFRSAPLIGIASPTAWAWAAVLGAIAAEAEVTRVVGTVLSSAAGIGHAGVAALSQESIALFNQSEAPTPGPSGQAVAFDVLPVGGIDCERVRGELVRALGEGVGVSLSGVQVPTFAGEGSSLAIELAAPITREILEERLRDQAEVSIVPEGPGSRGLEAVDEEPALLVGPTLRDVAGAEDVLVGRIESDASLPEGQGWRLWVAIDPLGLASAQAVRIAAQRLGLA